MADYTVTVGANPTGVHKTLTGATADTVTITGAAPYRIEVLNNGTGVIYCRADGTAAAAAADGTVRINAGQGVHWLAGLWEAGSKSTAVSVVGSGDAYSVHAVAHGAW